RNLNIAYQELSSTQAQLFQSAKLSAVGELAAGIAHEIANPLSTIIGDAQLLLRSTPSDSPAFESAQAIERSGQRARRVIRNLLDFSRQEEYEFSPTDLNANLETALSLIAHQIKGSSIQLITDLGQNLPPIAASPHHLEEVWINLLMNARDSIPEGRQGQITIHSHVLQENEVATVVVEISDNGCGIPENKLDRIFEPFYTTKELGKGTGLGLYVVHTIIKRHDGQVSVQSKEGEGTTFSIHLPALSPEALESSEDELEYAQSV
ncbi:MAG: GHKL domain-containing protein, partial [Chloroflexi bacterium]|nr:GHKL domain-containing protein [Chloroflexota bacterium]